MTRGELRNELLSLKNVMSLEDAAISNYKGKFPHGSFNMETDGWVIPLAVESIFDNVDVIVAVNTYEPEIVTVTSYVDGEDVMYYPLDRFIEDFTDVLPFEAMEKLDPEDESLW